MQATPTSTQRTNNPWQRVCIRQTSMESKTATNRIAHPPAPLVAIDCNIILQECILLLSHNVLWCKSQQSTPNHMWWYSNNHCSLSLIIVEASSIVVAECAVCCLVKATRFNCFMLPLFAASLTQSILNVTKGFQTDVQNCSSLHTFTGNNRVTLSDACCHMCNLKRGRNDCSPCLFGTVMLRKVFSNIRFALNT